MQEVRSAIEYAKRQVEIGRLVGAPSRVIDEIRNIKSEEDWDNASSQTRVMVAMAFGPSKYPEYGLFITPTEGDVPKWKARVLIMEILHSKYLTSV